MGEKVETVVYRFPENVDKVLDVLPEFLGAATAFLKQATSTVHDLDGLAPGTAITQFGEFFEAATELINGFSKSRESLSTIPSEVKEVKQALAGMSNALKGVDKRLKNVEHQKTEPTAAPVKKGWQGHTQPHNTKSNRHQREGQSPAVSQATVPQLPSLQEVQQNANAGTEGAVKIEGTVTRETTEKSTAGAAPFNSSLSSQLSTKVKAIGT